MCHYFKTVAGCDKGARCPFSHGAPKVKLQPRPAGAAAAATVESPLAPANPYPPVASVPLPFSQFCFAISGDLTCAAIVSNFDSTKVMSLIIYNVGKALMRDRSVELRIDGKGCNAIEKTWAGAPIASTSATVAVSVGVSFSQLLSETRMMAIVAIAQRDEHDHRSVKTRLVTCHENGRIGLWDLDSHTLENVLFSSTTPSLGSNPPYWSARDPLFSYYHNDRQRFLIRVEKFRTVHVIDLKSVCFCQLCSPALLHFPRVLYFSAFYFLLLATGGCVKAMAAIFGKPHSTCGVLCQSCPAFLASRCHFSGIQPATE
jgi:hypothetical protein